MDHQIYRDHANPSESGISQVCLLTPAVFRRKWDVGHNPDVNYRHLLLTERHVMVYTVKLAVTLC